MPTISNLTQAQVELCDKIWACDTQEDVENFIAGLPDAEDRHEARLLQTMMMAAIIDEEIRTHDDCGLARNVLDRISGSY